MANSLDDISCTWFSFGTNQEIRRIQNLREDELYVAAKEFPAIEADDKMVDAVCMMLVMHPENFDILVMPNLYGDIVSDLTSGLIGGLGLLPSSNIGDRLAMFEAVHGSAPDIAGKGIANPTAFLWSACMMLEHLGDNETAASSRRAVDATLKEAKSLTPDLGGTATTHDYELVRIVGDRVTDMRGGGVAGKYDLDEEGVLRVRTFFGIGSVRK